MISGIDGAGARGRLELCALRASGDNDVAFVKKDEKVVATSRSSPRLED